MLDALLILVYIGIAITALCVTISPIAILIKLSQIHNEQKRHNKSVEFYVSKISRAVAADRELIG